MVKIFLFVVDFFYAHPSLTQSLLKGKGYKIVTFRHWLNEQLLANPSKEIDRLTERLILFNTVLVNGGFTEWSEYSACSKTCGKGEQTRTRTCTNPLPSGGGKGCGKITQQKKNCNLGKC